MLTCKFRAFAIEKSRLEGSDIIYRLDRGISATLDVPVSLADIYISSTLYTERPQEPSPMPWLNDILPVDTPTVIPTLATFAHTCKIRLIQSYIMHTMQSVPLEGGATAEWQESMRLQIDNWADEIYSHRLVLQIKSICIKIEWLEVENWQDLIGHRFR